MKIFSGILFLLLSFSAVSQNLSSFQKINKIDFLNLEGEFYFNNNIYYDADTNQYGVFEQSQCTGIGSRPWKQYANVGGYIIADYYIVQCYGVATYEDGFYYFKTGKDFYFFDFLKENTVDGKLKDKDKLTLKGKRIKLYKTINRNSKRVKLSDRI